MTPASQTETSPHREKWLKRGCWVLGWILFVCLCSLAIGEFLLNCRCWRGSAKMMVFNFGLYAVSLRFLVGCILAERPFKMAFYIPVPFVTAWILDYAARMVMEH